MWVCLRVRVYVCVCVRSKGRMEPKPWGIFKGNESLCSLWKLDTRKPRIILIFIAVMGHQIFLPLELSYLHTF